MRMLHAFYSTFNPLHAKYTYMCMGVVKKKEQEKRKKDVP